MYQPTPMSVNTKNTVRSRGNQANKTHNLQSQNNFTPRTNNALKSTGSPNFISEELHYQQEEGEEASDRNKLIMTNEEEIYFESEETTSYENFQQAPEISGT